MRKVKGLIVLFVLLSLSFGACSKKDTGGASSVSGVDTSEQVELVIYTHGYVNPRDMDKINEAASKITLEKLNCTVNLQVMADWPTRYDLALSSGEPIDMIWTAMWHSYQPMAFDGAWHDITEMVDQVAPELRTLIGEENWNMSRIKGRDYAIPTSNRQWGQWGVAWREDLRKKMGTPEIKDIASLEAYADGILKNYPGMIPFCDSRNSGLFHSYSEMHHAYIGLGSPQFAYGLAARTDNPRELFVFHKTKEFEDYVLLERKWIERGYTQPDIASSTDTGGPGMLSEKYAGSMNAQGINATLTNIIVPAKQAHPDWEIGYMNFGEMFKWAYRAHPTFMAMALPTSGENPERTLLFVKELLTNKALFQLYDMGIEGEHYKVEDGYYVSLNDPMNPGYLQNASTLTNYIFQKDFKLYDRDYDWQLNYEKNHMEPNEVMNYFEGFPEDYAPYRDKQTALSEINTQYTWPIVRGAVANPLAALKEANERLDAAGRMEVVESVIQQYQEYLDGLGVPK